MIQERIPSLSPVFLSLKSLSSFTLPRSHTLRAACIHNTHKRPPLHTTRSPTHRPRPWALGAYRRTHKATIPHRPRTLHTR